MSASPPPSDGLPPDPEPAAEAPVPEESGPVAVPPVVAVVVTRDPGPWLEETLESITGSDYPSLTVLVLDAGSAEDPTPRVAAVAPGTFVRRLPQSADWATVANDVLSVVAGATFLLFVHDDVTLDPDAVRLLVEEAYRSNAAIVGPKLVDHERPEVLLEVGMAIDRFGHPHSGIEPGELDQEQHDAVRDVFFVSSTAMLVRADLFSELQGFDPKTFPGAEDLDLCWRARIAGARVLVVPDARARHRQADTIHDPVDAVSPAAAQRSQLRALLKSASGWSLAIRLPIAFVLAVVEVIAFLLTRRADRARALIGAWTWNLRNLRDVRAARKEAQSHRRVPDADLRFLQVRGSARVRGYLVGSLQTEDRMRSLSQRGRSAADTASSQLRAPASIGALVFVFLFLVGSRQLFFGRVAAIGQLPTWPGLSEMLATFTSAWRYTDLGSTAAAPPELALFSLLSTGTLGAAGFARTLVVILALPLGVLCTWRLARRITGPGSAAVVAALAYGINPLPRNAIAAGRLGPLVLYALAPMIVSGLLRIGGYLPDSPERRWWRAVVGTAAVLALATAVWPVAWLLPLVVLLSFALAELVAHEVGCLRRLARGALAAMGVALVVLLPWPLAYLRAGDRLAALGFAFRVELDLSSILRFQTGPNGAGVSGWVVLGAGLLVLGLASGPRLVWATRAWIMALISFLTVWFVARFAPDALAPSVDGLLVPAALGVSLAVGLGVAAFIEDVSRFHFGWRQVAAVGGAIALSFPVLAFAVDSLDGRWHQPAHDWNENLSWMRAEDADGPFRVLWLGAPAVLPVDPVVHGDVGFGVTNDGPGDTRTSLPPPAGGASARVGAAVDLLRDRRTVRVGAVLGPLGVRYLAVPERAGPGVDRTDPAPPALLVSLAEQLDLVRLEGPPGLDLYENRSWIPGAAVVPPRFAPRGEPGVLDGAAAAEAARPVVDGERVRRGTVTWSQAYSDAWAASSGGKDLPHRRVYGWANGYSLDRAGEVSFSFTQQWWRYPVVLLELALVIGAWLLWRGSARFEVPWRRRAEADGADEADGAAAVTS